jgi:hypothetical protein
LLFVRFFTLAESVVLFILWPGQKRFLFRENVHHQQRNVLFAAKPTATSLREKEIFNTRSVVSRAFFRVAVAAG